MEDVIRNKVAESGIITLNLEDFYPKGEVVTADKRHLFSMGGEDEFFTAGNKKNSYYYSKI